MYQNIASTPNIYAKVQSILRQYVLSVFVDTGRLLASRVRIGKNNVYPQKFYGRVVH